MIVLKVPGLNNGHPITVKEIIRIEAFSNYSRIYFSNGKVAVAAKVLHWFEDSLPEAMFARVHRSHLVNKSFVENFKGAGSKSLLLCNGDSIAVSRRRKVLIVDSIQPLAPPPACYNTLAKVRLISISKLIVPKH